MAAVLSVWLPLSMAYIGQHPSCSTWRSEVRHILCSDFYGKKIRNQTVIKPTTCFLIWSWVVQLCLTLSWSSHQSATGHFEYVLFRGVMGRSQPLLDIVGGMWDVANSCIIEKWGRERSWTGKGKEHSKCGNLPLLCWTCCLQGEGGRAGECFPQKKRNPLSVEKRNGCHLS